MAKSDRLRRLQQRLGIYYRAEEKVLAGQSYRIGNRSATRADLGEIRRTINDLENQIAMLEAQLAGHGRRKAYRIMPRDL